MTGVMAIAPEFFQHGDRLSREEFLERWERMPKLKNTELIDRASGAFSNREVIG